MRFSLHSIFADLPQIHIVDIGASDVEGPPPYQRFLDEDSFALLIGFEPNPVEFQKLIARPQPKRVYLPYAVGQGGEAVLNVCFAAGMSSLLEPNFKILRHFHAFEEWGQVVNRIPVVTRRLDDVSEIKTVDYLKLDVQGSELAILRGGTRTLAGTLVVHLEMPFVPLYRDQPMFGDIDIFLRSAGFRIHTFRSIKTGALKAVPPNDGRYAGLYQLIETDAVYVRNFDDFDQLPAGDLLKIARIAHDLWGSVDLTALALGCADSKAGSSRQNRYLNAISNLSDEQH
jgi:FkbM family methyltransferase